MIEDDPRFDDEIRGALRHGPPPATSCADDATLAAFYAGLLGPQTEEAMRDHLAACPGCVARARDARAFVSAMTPVRHRPVLRPWALAAAAGLAGLAILLGWRAATAPRPAAPALVATTEKREIVVDKAPYTPDADEGLLWRGGAEPPPADGSFAWAMEPYLGDEFEVAADRLERCVSLHPDDDRARFYLGVARLLAGNPSASVEPLLAVAGGASDRADDAVWYLALAYLKTGDTKAAAPHLRRVASGVAREADRARILLREIEEPPAR